MKFRPTQVMGILNVTPDSFSDGGKFAKVDAAIRHAYDLLEAGADVVDIGGESTRPTAEHVSAAEEFARIEPVLARLVRDRSIRLSVDTYKAEVATRALDYGVQMINDVWGGLADAKMLSTVAEAKCTYIWMHNRSARPVGDGWAELLEETLRGIERCLAVGIDKSKLWIDPGIGFGKSTTQNLLAIKRLPEYTELGYPVLLGTSRKSFIGTTLDLPPDDRLEGSLATVSFGVMAGVTCVRVHDVRETVRTCRMMEAIRDADSDTVLE